MTSPNRAERLIAFAVAAAVLLVAILTVTPWPVGAFQDDAIYAVLAKSIATGQGYRLLNLPGAPNATHYPPGYPLVLAALWRLWPNFPDNIVLFKFANAFFLAGAAWATFVFSRRRLAWPVWGSAVAAIAGTLSIVVLLITGVVLSEPLFMVCLLAALLLAEQAADGVRSSSAFAAGVALGAVTLVRTIGVAGVGALVLVLLVRRKWVPAAAAACGALILLVPWQLWVAAHAHEVATVLTGKYGSYSLWLMQGYREEGLALLKDVVLANVRSVHAMMSYVFLPMQAELPRRAVIACLAALSMAGLMLLWRRAAVTCVFLVLYAGITMVWPFEPNRFLLAIWPLLLIVLALPVTAGWQARPMELPRRVARGAVLLAAGVMLLGFARYNLMGFQHQWWASVQRDAGRRAKPIAEWVVRHAAPTDVLATDDDLIVYLYTGRQGVPTSTFLASERVRPLTAEEDRLVVRELLLTYRPRFFITASQQGIATATTLSEPDKPMLKPFGNTSNALVYERLTP
jgi:hypothetical protein